MDLSLLLLSQVLFVIFCQSQAKALPTPTMSPTPSSGRGFWVPVDSKLVDTRVNGISTSADGKYVFLTAIPGASISRDGGATFTTPYDRWRGGWNISECTTGQYRGGHDRAPASVMDDTGQFIFLIGYYSLCNSADFGNTFRLTYTDTMPLTVAGDGSGRYLSYTSIDGLYTSSDFGVTWKIVFKGMETSFPMISHNGQVFIVAIQNQGNYISKDYGSTWQPLPVESGTGPFASSYDGVHLIAVNRRFIYPSHIAYSHNAGVSWVVYSDIMIWGDPYQLLCNPSCTRVFALQESGLSMSTQEGVWFLVDAVGGDTMGRMNASCENIYIGNLYRSYFSVTAVSPTYDPTAIPTARPTVRPSSVYIPKEELSFEESPGFKAMISVISFIVPLIAGYIFRTKIAFRILQLHGFKFKLIYADDNSPVSFHNNEFGLCWAKNELCFQTTSRLIPIAIDNGVNQGLVKGLYDVLVTEVNCTYAIRSGRSSPFVLSEFEVIFLRDYLLNNEVVKPVSFCCCLNTFAELGTITGVIYYLCLTKYEHEYMQFWKKNSSKGHYLPIPDEESQKELALAPVNVGKGKVLPL